MNERELIWYRRGRADGLTAAPILHFDDAPSRWTAAEVQEARAAYNAGLDSGNADFHAYQGILEEIAVSILNSPTHLIQTGRARRRDGLKALSHELRQFIRKAPGAPL